MRFLIVDDSILKITELSKVIFEDFPTANVITSESIENAIKILSKEETFNVIFIDLYLPIKQNEFAIEDGGKKLLSEIYRKKDSLNLPNYVLGFSQYEVEDNDFSSIWKVVNYKSNSDDWKSQIKNLLTHLKYSNFINNENELILPRVFVEGLTDKFYLETACDLFFKEHIGKFEIVSQENAGANWVGSQMSITAIKLAKDASNEYIKSIGILDSDEAGNKAKKDFESRNLTENEKKCCVCHQLKVNYNPDIVKFYRNGCKIEIEIESLFPIEIYLHAENEKWLEHRTKTFVEDPTDWEQHNETSIAYINRKLGNDNLSLYVKKVTIGKKNTFRKHIASLENKEEIFKNFKPLLQDILDKLNIK